jgi:hypothetical protein
MRYRQAYIRAVAMETAAIYHVGSELSAYTTAGVDGFTSQKTAMRKKAINSLSVIRVGDLITRYVSNCRE